MQHLSFTNAYIMWYHISWCIFVFFFMQTSVKESSFFGNALVDYVISYQGYDFGTPNF